MHTHRKNAMSVSCQRVHVLISMWLPFRQSFFPPARTLLLLRRSPNLTLIDTTPMQLSCCPDRITCWLPQKQMPTNCSLEHTHCRWPVVIDGGDRTSQRDGLRRKTCARNLHYLCEIFCCDGNVVGWLDCKVCVEIKPSTRDLMTVNRH